MTAKVRFTLDCFVTLPTIWGVSNADEKERETKISFRSSKAISSSHQFTIDCPLLRFICQQNRLTVGLGSLTYYVTQKITIFRHPYILCN